MASVTILPTFPFHLPLLTTPHLHPIPLPLLGVTLWIQHPCACQCSPAPSPSRCCRLCSPARTQHAALVSLLTALHHIHCSLTAIVCKTAFPPSILTFSLFSSLSLSFSCSSLPTALLLTQGKCFFSFPLPALALFSSPSVSTPVLVFTML